MSFVRPQQTQMVIQKFKLAEWSNKLMLPTKGKEKVGNIIKLKSFDNID
jgi:hypothetical protein